MEVRKRAVQGEGKVEETTMEATDSHSFKSTNLKKPTWCDHCGKMIWGLYNQGQKCGECGIKIHHKCHHSVSDFCGNPPKGTVYNKNLGALGFSLVTRLFFWTNAASVIQPSVRNLPCVPCNRAANLILFSGMYYCVGCINCEWVYFTGYRHQNLRG